MDVSLKLTDQALGSQPAAVPSSSAKASIVCEGELLSRVSETGKHHLAQEQVSSNSAISLSNISVSPTESSGLASHTAKISVAESLHKLFGDFNHFRNWDSQPELNLKAYATDFFQGSLFYSKKKHDKAFEFFLKQALKGNIKAIQVIIDKRDLFKPFLEGFFERDESLITLWKDFIEIVVVYQQDSKINLPHYQEKLLAKIVEKAPENFGQELAPLRRSLVDLALNLLAHQPEAMAETFIIVFFCEYYYNAETPINEKMSFSKHQMMPYLLPLMMKWTKDAEIQDQMAFDLEFQREEPGLDEESYRNELINRYSVIQEECIQTILLYINIKFKQLEQEKKLTLETFQEIQELLKELKSEPNQKFKKKIEVLEAFIMLEAARFELIKPLDKELKAWIKELNRVFKKINAVEAQEKDSELIAWSVGGIFNASMFFKHILSTMELNGQSLIELKCLSIDHLISLNLLDSAHLKKIKTWSLALELFTGNPELLEDNIRPLLPLECQKLPRYEALALLLKGLIQDSSSADSKIKSNALLFYGLLVYHGKVKVDLEGNSIDCESRFNLASQWLLMSDNQIANHHLYEMYMLGEINEEDLPEDLIRVTFEEIKHSEPYFEALDYIKKGSSGLIDKKIALSKAIIKCEESSFGTYSGRLSNLLQDLFDDYYMSYQTNDDKDLGSIEGRDRKAKARPSLWKQKADGFLNSKDVAVLKAEEARKALEKEENVILQLNWTELAAKEYNELPDYLQKNTVKILDYIQTWQITRARGELITNTDNVEKIKLEKNEKLYSMWIEGGDRLLFARDSKSNIVRILRCKGHYSKKSAAKY